MLPDNGYYSSYTKTLKSFIYNNDTIYISQLFSKVSSSYNSEADGFFDLSPLSIYWSDEKVFTTIQLPNFSGWSDKNYGQPILNFDYNENENIGYFVISPDCKLYKFSIDKDKKIFKNKYVYSFTHLYSNDVRNYQRNNENKDITKITTQNPIFTSLIATNQFEILSYSKGLTDSQYLQMSDYRLSLAQRGLLFSKYRPTFLLLFGKDMSCKGSIPLPENIENAPISVNDSIFLLKPKMSVFYGKDSLWFYYAKIKKNEKI